MEAGGIYDHAYDEEGLFGYALRSLLAHVGVIGVVIFFTMTFDFFSSDVSDENINLIEASVKVDVVAMPKMTVKELQALQQQAGKSGQAVVKPKEQTKQAQVKVEKVADDSKAPVLNEAKKKTSVADILSRAASQKTETIEGTQEKADQGVSQAARKRLRSLVAAGNKISEGTSISGSGNSAEAMNAFNRYISQLPELIRVNWRLPSYLMDKELRCRVRVYLSENGKLMKAEIYESSGNDEYDQRALKAVRESDPFPPLESSITARAVKGEILLGFPL